ncbi:MAG: hypothetical protein NVS3B20_22930 [Polyangiales bacterium]
MNAKEISTELAHLRELAAALCAQIEALQLRVNRTSEEPKRPRASSPPAAVRAPNARVPSLEMPAVRRQELEPDPESGRSYRIVPTKK